MTDLTPLSTLQQARMRALRNGIYHSMRRSHYERMEQVLNFAVIVLGTAAAADVMRSLGSGSIVVWGALTAIVGTTQLVWGPGSRARAHSMLQAKFYALVARSEGARGREDETAGHIEQELAALYAEESTTMHAVNALAYNAVQQANGRPETSLLPVNGWERLVAHWWAFSADRFRPTSKSKSEGGSDRAVAAH